VTATEFRDIRLYRLGFTIAEAARMFECDERTMKRWRSGEVRIPSSVALVLRLLRLVATNPSCRQALGVTSWRDLVPALSYSADHRRALAPS
jgi:DNA-binding transcriptional regulator YiaG